MGFKQDATQFDVSQGLGEEIDVGSHEVVRPARIDHLFHQRYRLRGGHVIKGNAE
jgi:hypothetical protein